VAVFQTNLLQIAFDVATSIPLDPHIKDRSRTQYQVITACFDLDQPQRALRDMKQIGNWQRGEACADYAFYSVKCGYTNDVEQYLNLAEQISLTADQDWRRDRIKVRISQTRLLLGQSGRSAHFLANAENSESGKVVRVEALLCGDNEDAYRAQTDSLDRLFGLGDFETTKNVLYAYVELFKRFYNHQDRRDHVEQKIKEYWVPMPLMIRVDLMIRLAETALQNKDQSKALALVKEGRSILDGATWPAQYHIQLGAQLAALRFSAGDQDAALVELKEEVQLFADQKSSIINIYKAEALMPIAEAYATMHDAATALTVYQQALEAAIENPNSRPQAEDLVAICLSMALNKIAPDEPCWTRIREIQAGLGEPW